MGKQYSMNISPAHWRYLFKFCKRIVYVLNIFPNFQLQLISKRCDYNVTHCEVHDTLSIRDICKLMGLEAQFWSEFMKNVPKINCPFEKSTIKIPDATVELGYIAHLPLDGYTWIFTEKVFKSVKGRKIKRMVFCVAFQVTIRKYRPGRKKN